MKRIYSTTSVILALGILVLTAILFASALERRSTQKEECRREGLRAPTDPDARREAMAAAAKHSEAVGGWALLIIGGSLAALIGTSYTKPIQRSQRLMYILFIPGWIFLAMSLVESRDAVGHSLASLFTADIYLPRQTNCFNSALARQLDSMGFGLVFFGAWIVCYLVWWMYSEKPKSKV